MAENKVLLVSSRNLYTANGEWRLVSSRAATLRQAFGIETDALALIRKHHLTTGQKAPDIPGFKREYVLCDSWANLPGAMYRLLRALRRKLGSTRYRGVIVSGDLVYPLIPWLPVERTLVDLHGVPEEWVEYPNPRLGSAWIRKALFHVAICAHRWVVPRAAGVLAVTNELAKLSVERYGARHTYVVPCVGEYLVADDPLAVRHGWRRRLGIADGEVAFVYSGGLSPWQLFDETVKCYRTWRQHLGLPSRLVLFTPDPEWSLTRSLQLGVARDEIVSISLSPEDVVPALHACDVGFVLREDNWTNRVAFPNKFSEYCAAGLLIATSPGLREAAHTVAEQGIGVQVDARQVEHEALQHLDELRAKIMARAHEWTSYYSRCRALVNTRYSMKHALQPVADFFLDGRP